MLLIFVPLLLHNIFLLFSFFSHTSSSSSVSPTGGPDLRAFDTYVSTPDAHYKWEYLSDKTHLPEYGVTVYMLNLTSQKWQDETYVRPSIWTHFLAVIVPDGVNAPKKSRESKLVDKLGFLWITHGDTGERPDPHHFEDIQVMSKLCSEMDPQAICAVLCQVPNEPAIFPGEKPHPVERDEDAIIAYTWWDFIHNGDKNPDYLLRFPMVKSAIRAMDAIEEYVEDFWTWGVIGSWVVGGASKRGWTSWLVGAYDAVHEKRVRAIIPSVMSMVNMTEQFHVWWKMMGGWSFALRDYYEMDLFVEIGHDKFPAMAYQIDAYEYAERYSEMDVLEMFGTQDEFFTLLDPWQYWSGMKFRQKHMAFVPNADHSLERNLEFFLKVVTPFVSAYLPTKSPEMPVVDFSRNTDIGSLTMETSKVPSVVKLWKGISIIDADTRMDFRLFTLDDPCPGVKQGDMCMCDVKWESSDVAIGKGQKKFVVTMPPDPNGKSTGFYFEVQFAPEDDSELPLVFTTAPMIVPFKFPYKDCGSGEPCRGKLL